MVLLTCSSHIGTALYETHVASQEESECVDKVSIHGAPFEIADIKKNFLLLPDLKIW